MDSSAGLVRGVEDLIAAIDDRRREPVVCRLDCVIGRCDLSRHAVVTPLDNSRPNPSSFPCGVVDSGYCKDRMAVSASAE